LIDQTVQLEKFLLILGFGRLETTEYRVLPSIWYSAEPGSRAEYRFSFIQKSDFLVGIL